MRIKKLSSRQVFLGIGAAVAVALAGTDVSTAQKLRSSDIMYPTLHWELLEPSAAGWSADCSTRRGPMRRLAVPAPS